MEQVVFAFHKISRNGWNDIDVVGFFYTLRVRISLLTRPNREKEKVSFFILAAHVKTVYQNYTVCISVLRTSYLVLDFSSLNIYRVLWYGRFSLDLMTHFGFSFVITSCMMENAWKKWSSKLSTWTSWNIPSHQIN